MSVVELTQKLIQFPSETPLGAACLDFIQQFLENKGFSCYRLPFGVVDNLYARFGEGSPNFCFAGHVDVVSPLNHAEWTFPPYAGVIKGETLYGRGAVDMKGAIAAFMEAAASFLKTPFKGSISFLLTSDEEGPALNGTQKVLRWLEEKQEKIDVCLVGEPTNPLAVGDMIKIGRRGSLSFEIEVDGKAGHVAYPDLAQNPIPVLLKFLQEIIQTPLDFGTEEFSPSNLEITSIDVGNVTSNLIPSKAKAMANIRFNTLQSGLGLVQKLQQIASRFPLKIDLLFYPASEAFILKNPTLIRLVSNAIEFVCGKKPVVSTSGGTSDARFIKDYCPVIEFGLINATAHHIDERVEISELVLLEKIYYKILMSYFNHPLM